jgi:DNA-binding MarR family transcriptional regulator
LDLNNYLPYRLLVVTAKVTQAYEKRYKRDFGISIPESRVLNVLGQYHTLSSTEMGELTTMTKSRVSAAVNRLLTIGMLVRIEDREDQRVFRLEFSPSGRELYERMVPVALEMEEKLISTFGPRDRATFMKLLNAIEGTL